MDAYIHKQHRSLSRTPWEVYYARPSPHPLKSIKQFEPFTMLDVDSCSNPKTESISSLDENSLMDDMRIHSDKCQSIIIQTLTQTRKIQVENHRKISKQLTLYQKFEIGMIAYMCNPNISGKLRKRNLHEPVNVKVIIIKINSTSNQCFIEYKNLKKDIKRVWVNNADLVKIGNEKTMEIKDLIFQGKDRISSFSEQFNRIKYNKLLFEFEQITADKWCNTRKTVQNLRQTTYEDDQKKFIGLDERNTTNHENGESEMIFYQELLFEVFDGLFVEFCADSHNISIFINSESTLLKLKYLAHQGFKEYLGILQLWHRNRIQDECGIYFGKLLQTLDPVTTHRCEERIFSGNYTHDCCFQLLKFHYNQQTEIRKSTPLIDGNDTPFQFKANKRLTKRKYIFSDPDNEFSSDSICDDINVDKFTHFSKLENFFVSIPLELIHSSRPDSILNESDIPSITNTMDVDFIIPQAKSPKKITKQTGKLLCDKSEERQKYQSVQYIAYRTRSSNSSNYYFLPVDNEWRTLKCKILLDFQKLPTFSSVGIIPQKFMLDDCIPEEKISIIIDGNCLFRALAWWLSANEDIHEIVRKKLLVFMSTSSLCGKYVEIKHDQKMSEYFSKTNMSATTVWGSDVDLFSSAIWLETDIFVFKDKEWEKFSHKGFNPKRGKNVSSSLNIHLHNDCYHYEPIVSVTAKNFLCE